MDEGFKHLLRVLGLCQTPRDSWADEDYRALREAREYVQKRRKEASESEEEEGSRATAGEAAQECEDSPPEGGV